jgi:hypothetical protein
MFLNNVEYGFDELCNVPDVDKIDDKPRPQGRVRFTPVGFSPAGQDGGRPQ